MLKKKSEQVFRYINKFSKNDIGMLLKSMQICSIRKTDPVIFVPFITTHTSISSVM